MSKFEPCMETVQIWIEDFNGNIKERAIAAEIEGVKGTIANELLWQRGSSTKEQEDIHEQNITDLEAYLVWLRSELRKRDER